ncbi:MAG: glucose-6-phosphate dehydrogenase assembly protein OpcA [Acidimicrobiia bacterium]|nr:glucose-6-phosphate dehydrogenase assembly protein OpcA [Acidimicrobiia bacterium]MBV9039590.1 glucose-6-phosphate dehydrogenase assembly protein OpcA [Acidimicrobiia bacterium]
MSQTQAAVTPSVPFDTIGSWEAENVTAAQVERALSELRRHEERAALRTSVLTLVIVVGSTDEAGEHLDVVRHLGARHPSRTLVLVLNDEDEAESRLDASVSVCVVDRGGRQVAVEEMVIGCHGPARFHLDSLVLPFTLPDLPVAVWLPSSIPSKGDPLIETADRVVVDTRVVGWQPDALQRLHSLIHRVAITDLSWWRLKPWRNLFAGLFEGHMYRPFLRTVQSLEVTGHPGPRHLLAGWVMSRLDLPRSVIHLGDAEHLSIKLVASHEGRRGRFEVVRKGEERVIDASVEIDDGPSFQQKVQIGEEWQSRSLADALGHMGHNETYEAALEAAMGLLH